MEIVLMLRTLLTFSFLTIQFIPFSAFSESDTSELDELIVTGSHTPIRLDEIGSSYTVISKEQIEQRQAVLVSDLLRDVPGLTVSRTGVVGSQTQVRIRGAEANHLLVLIDGIEVNDIAGGDEFNFAHLVTSNIERIEIIRGPHSALYGSDALAGVINIITKKGSGTTTISAYAEKGSFSTFNGGGSISAGGDRYHYNLQAAYLNTAGNNIAPIGSEDDRYENRTLSFTAGLNPWDSLKINIIGRHTRAENETDDQDFVFTGFAVDADNATQLSQNYWRGQATIGSSEQGWEHTAGVAVTSTDNDNFVAGVAARSTQGKKFRFDYKTNAYLDTKTFVNATHILTFAIDHEKDVFTQRGTVNPFGGDPNQKQAVKTTGFVGGYRVNLWEQLFLSASVRHDNNSDFKNATSYRVTSAYNILDFGTRLHASYGTGIKRPTFTDRFGFSPNTFIGNPNLKAEKSKSWDVGVEQSLWSGKVSLGVNYFHAKLEDEINGFFFNGSGFTAVNVDGISKRQGVEITAEATLTDKLDISAAYTWLDATEPNAGIQTAEIRRPRNTANINVNYAFLNNRANANLNISHTGTQKDTKFAPFPFAIVDLGSYTLVNLTSSYQINKNITVYARAENLLDTDYVDIFGFQTPGISATVGLNMTFQP